MTPRQRRGSVGALALTVGVAALLLGAGAVWAERTEVGTLIVSLDANLSPHSLPRRRYVPAALRLNTTFSTRSGALTPRLKGLTIDLSNRGRLFNKGLPSCTLRRLEPSSVRRALSLCGDAQVGWGRLHAIVALPEQSPFRFRARLLAFSGPPAKGQQTILVLAYGPRPPTSFVLPFVIHRNGFDLGTRLTTQVPEDAGASAHIGGFTIVIKRTFTYHGQRRSFINADCPVPHGFTAGVIPFARAIYHFAETPNVTTVIARGCRVGSG